MRDDVEVMRVIKTTLTKRGAGEAPDDPVREITQYWDMDGNLLWEEDPLDDMGVCCEVEELAR